MIDMRILLALGLDNMTHGRGDALYQFAKGYFTIDQLMEIMVPPPSLFKRVLLSGRVTDLLMSIMFVMLLFGGC